MWIKRSGIVYVTIIALMTAVIFRTYYVSQGAIADKTRAVAGKRVASVRLYSSKGVIYDRNLCALAGNQYASYMLVDPRSFDRKNTEKLCEMCGCDVSEISDRLNRESPFVLKSYYAAEQMDGVYVYDGTARYPENRTATHLVGYLDSDMKVGVSGIEKAFNDELSQFSGGKSISYSKNALNGLMSAPEAESSDDSLNGVILTVDRRLNFAVDEALSEYVDRGCAVVMDCTNGEILALSSRPDYDVNKISEYIGSDGGELVNNALSRQTVGSVFKMVIAACAIRNGLEDFRYECRGGINVAGRTFYCQNNRVHGELDLETAFSESCNAYFIALGQLLGYDKIIETAQLFGADSSIELAKNTVSFAGVLPEDTGVLSVANLSIGQGELMLTPLEIARITAAVCNGGYLVNPTVYYGTYINGTIGNRSILNYRTGVLSGDTAEKLRRMCINCVESGTGAAAAPAVGGAGGKTASAQTGVYKASGAEQLNTYFTGFYPADAPKYAITVFAVDGKSGSATCAPVFRKICDFIAQNY